MVLGLLKPILNPLVSPAASTAAPQSSVARAAAQAAAQQASAPRSGPQSAAAEPSGSGVRFDLSDKALQMAERVTASSAPGATPGSAASLGQPADEPAPTAVEVTAQGPETLDPSEEERARAWAIRGMERERLLDLVETLRVTPKADPAEREVAQYTAAQPSVQAAPREGTAAA